MSILIRVNRMFRRSTLLREIETSKKRLLAAPANERMRYELELKAYRQQIRLLDEQKHQQHKNPLKI